MLLLIAKEWNQPILSKMIRHLLIFVFQLDVITGALLIWNQQPAFYVFISHILNLSKIKFPPAKMFLFIALLVHIELEQQDVRG